jgi:hypothetical protein
MSLLNPIVSKFTMAPGVAQEVYTCPNTKSHAVVDLTFFKNDTTTSSLVAVGLSTESNPGALTSVDYFIDDIQLINEVNSAELTKVMVGAGERLFVKVLEGTSVSMRVAGVEETNSKVVKAGRLGASSVVGTSQTKVFDATSYPTAAYVSTSVTIFNTSTTDNSKVEVWISSSEIPTDTDKVMMITVPMQDTTIIENVLLLPNEKIFVASDVANVEYFINGVVISQ